MGAAKGGVVNYSRPYHGVFRFIPDVLVPYAELMRIDRQAGFWAYYWHYLIGIGFAINIQPFSSEMDVKSITVLALYLAIWVTIFRGITCTWNDNLDQDFDRQVARCRVRPIPRGAVSTNQAHSFMFALMAAGAYLLYPYGKLTLIHAAVDSVMLFIYPFLKRMTHFPQVELGFGLSYAIYIVAAMLGKDPLAPLLDSSMDFSARMSKVAATPEAQAALCVYVAGILWSVIFDTLYAHQDYLDDLKAGVMGVAVFLGRKGTKPTMYVLAAIQVYCLVLAGQLAGFSQVYFAATCASEAAVLIWMIWATDLEDPDSCAWAFGRGSGYVGTAISGGLALEFFAKKYGY